jgi:hypothetical protein
MENNVDQNLAAQTRSLEGLGCWYVSCGGAAGPSFQLALGGKVPRQAPLKNQAHSEEFRRFEGEANLLVWCTWRLDGPDGPLTSSDDTTANIATELQKLVGAAIESVALLPPAWDLTVRFNNGLMLRVFCDHVPGEPSFDGNWELWRRGVAVFVGPGARYEVEARGDSVGQAVPADR